MTLRSSVSTVYSATVTSQHLICRQYVFLLQVVSEVTPAPQSTAEEENDEEESHVSEGQLVPVSSQSYSDDSEISEEMAEGRW